jgi:hypothetical protein
MRRGTLQSSRHCWYVAEIKWEKCWRQKSPKGEPSFTHAFLLQQIRLFISFRPWGTTKIRRPVNLSTWKFVDPYIRLQKFIDLLHKANIRRPEHSLTQTFIDPNIHWLKTFIDLNIHRPEHSSTQTFTDPNIHQPKHSLTRTFGSTNIRHM